MTLEELKIVIDNKRMWESILSFKCEVKIDDVKNDPAGIAIKCIGDAIKHALKDQGLEYKHGEIVSMNPDGTETDFESKDELAESEDERIRKAIIKILHYTFSKDSVLFDVSREDMIAYLEKQVKNNMGISEATKKKLEDNLNKALEKETPESWNKFLDEQGNKEENLKERNICDTCEDSNGCLIPCCAKLLEKQGEQKMKTPEESLGIDSDTYNKIVDECIYGEQKSFWSEEDNRMCKAIIDNIKAICEEGYFVGNIDSGELIDWLKSLKERYTWRPSDEQMKALEHFVRSIGESGYASPYDNDTKLLYSLLFDLKKLREK